MARTMKIISPDPNIQQPELVVKMEVSWSHNYRVKIPNSMLRLTIPS